MIKTTKGIIDFGKGPIECDVGWKIEGPIDEEFAVQTRNLRDVIERVKQQVVRVALGGDIYVPTGPVVDSTLVEEEE